MEFRPETLSKVDFALLKDKYEPVRGKVPRRQRLEFGQSDIDVNSNHINN